jgi:hypothetical protein
MLQPHGSVYQAVVSPTQVNAVIARFPIGVNGQIVNFKMTIPVANGAGDFVVDIRKNGVTIFASPTDRPKIVAGATSGQIVGRIDAVLLSDTISLVPTSVPVGGVGNPLTFVLNVEDGLPTAGPQGIQGDPGNDGADGAPGAPGADGVSFIWRGQWDSETVYASNDVVRYFDETGFNESVWICLVGNTGIIPQSDPTKWERMLTQESPKLDVPTIVNTLYQGALARDPDPDTEYTPLATSLEAARVNAVDFIIAMKGIGSIYTDAEYIARGRSNEEFVLDLYMGLLGRGPEDMGTFDAWVANVVASGRPATRNGFINSPEFYQHRICRGYAYQIEGMNAGALGRRHLRLSTLRVIMCV